MGLMKDLLAANNYPQSGKPETVHFDVISKIPTNEEATRLTSMPLKKKPRSFGSIISGIFFVLIAIGFGIGGSFLGISIIENNNGIGIILGYFLEFVFPFIMLGVCISLFYNFFVRSAQKKTPEDALKWVYEKTLTGLGSSGSWRFGTIDEAVNDLRLIVPDFMSFDSEKVKKYITECRNVMTQAMELTTRDARGERNGGWTGDTPFKEIKISDKEEIYPSVTEIHATYFYADRLTREVSKAGSKETEKLIAAELELHITAIIIKSGEYWYPYDIFPEFKCRRELS